MPDWPQAQRKAASTARWAVTMTKVRIRRVLARTRWQLVTFYGKGGGESVGTGSSECKQFLGNDDPVKEDRPTR